MENSTISLLTDDELDSVAAAGRALFSFTSIRVAASYQRQSQSNSAHGAEVEGHGILAQGGAQSQTAVNNAGSIDDSFNTQVLIWG